MSFALKTRRIRGVVLVDMVGRLSVGEPVLLLRNTVRRLAEEDGCQFVLNLEAVSYIDGCGLGELVATYTSLTNKGCSMSLLNPTERTIDLLELSKLSTVFDVFDGESRAIEAQAGINDAVNRQEALRLAS